MKDKNWKRMIESWQASRKLQELKKKLQSRRMYTLGKEEIIEAIDAINEFHSLSDEDKEAFDWLDVDVVENVDKEDVIYSLIQTLIKWNFYLYKYEEEQDFELCIRVRDIIETEIDECKRMISTYFIVEDEDEETYAMLRIESRQNVQDNYYAWVNYLEQN
jgi:hypothetical protein